MDLQALDFLIIGVLLVSASLSLIRGFTKEVLSITGWVVSGYAAIFLGPSMKPVLAEYVTIDWVVSGGSMLLVFLITLISFSFISSQISGQLKGSSLGPLDRSLGILFGAARGLFIVCIAYLGISAVIPEKDHPDFIADAKLRPMLQTGSRSFVALVPLDRLPLNLSNIGETVSERVNEAVKDVGPEILQEVGESALQRVLDGAQSIEIQQDSLPDKGYKRNERDQIDRLIRNTEGATQ